jgi:hypothetical protein
MNADALKAAFKEAAEIANTVPESLREAAFNRRARRTARGRRGQRARLKAEATKQIKPATQTQKERNDTVKNPFEFLNTHLDRTAHPEISSAPRVLERALWLLRIARDEHSIDGIGATHIAKLLTEKFRLRTSPQAVQQALDAARQYVDRHTPRSGRTVYRIMTGGELHLDTPLSPKEPAAAATRAIRTPKSPKKKDKATKNEQMSTTGTAKRAKASSSKGAWAIVSKLIDEGFFNTPRTIRAIIDHAKGSLGYQLKANELSPPLLRALRSKKLQRAQNNENQYEYSKT